MKKLAVIPSDPISAYLSAGYGEKWLREYFNPLKFFDEVYVFSPKEKNNPDLLGMKAIHTQPHELPARLKEFKIDVVRAYGGFWPCAMACCNKVNGIPVVVSVHDTSQDLLRDAIAKADVVLSMSKAVRNLVLTKFKREDRAWLLPNRIHFDYMRPYTKVEIGDELDKKYPFKYKIIHVGRKVKQKNLDNLIISRIARVAGAPKDKGAGIYLYKHVGDKVKRGDKLFTIYSESRHEFEYAKDVAKSAKVVVVN